MDPVIKIGACSALVNAAGSQLADFAPEGFLRSMLGRHRDNVVMSSLLVGAIASGGALLASRGFNMVRLSAV